MIRRLLLIIALIIFSANPVFAEEIVIETPKVVINEYMVGGDSAYDEFVELAYLGKEALDISNWQLIYVGATGSECVIATLSQNLVTDSILLIASDKAVLPEGVVVDSVYVACGSSSVLSPTKGILNLVDDEGSVIDQVAYGDITASSDLHPMLAPIAGKSNQRRRDVETNEIIDTNDSLSDFELLDQPTPGLLQEINHPDDTTTDDDSDDETKTEEDTNPPIEEETEEQLEVNQEEPIVYLPILLSELFIDPPLPLTDANDEWVEIYNPNSEAVDLEGYTIYTGTNYSYKYIFKEGESISPGSYLIFTSGYTPLTLSNSGGAAKIVDPNGSELDATVYEKAKEGLAWAKDAGGVWQWTITPSPNSLNTIVPIPAPVPKTAQKAKKTTAKKATTTKVSTKKSTAVKGATKINEDPDLIAAPNPLPTPIIALLGVLALLYAGYEYRFEIDNKIYQLRQYAKDRRTNR